MRCARVLPNSTARESKRFRTASMCRASVPTRMRRHVPLPSDTPCSSENWRRTKVCTRSSKWPRKRASRYRWWSSATAPSARPSSSAGCVGGPRRQDSGLARQARGVPVAASRGAADVSIGVARAAEPCVDRSERAVGSDRGDRTPVVRRTSSSMKKQVCCRPRFQDWQKMLPALRPTHRSARGSEARRRTGQR